jgi:hypothetical protein
VQDDDRAEDLEGLSAMISSPRLERDDIIVSILREKKNRG